MSIPITRTKVILPRRRSDLLSRPRLVELLYELLEYKLIILAAPAGYGKTSLLVDFAHEVELPVCWLALDTLDRDPERFITHFIAAIAQGCPAFGSQSFTALAGTTQATLDLELLLPAIINEALDQIHEHFVLILDDYHLINDVKPIDAFVNRFVQEAGENCHLVLSSRSLLSLPDMPLMVARSTVGGLSFEELAFQSGEIQSLILQNYRLSMSDAAAVELAQETEGWITGLLLSAQTMWQGMADRLRVARVSGVGLYDYLAQQVLDQQPYPLREFLLRTSLLEEFDADLCQAAFGPGENYAARIDLLLQNNLFVLPVGEDGRWVRYHHLFRDFLQARFEEQEPESRDALLRRLTQVYAARGEWEKAYAAATRLGDPVALADFIEYAGTALIQSGRQVTLAAWIDALPDEARQKRYNLLSLRGVAHMVQGEPENGLSLLNSAEAGLRFELNRDNLAHTLTRRANAYRLLGMYQDAQRDASEALSIATETGKIPLIRAEALRALGMALYHTGAHAQAIDHLVRSLSAYQALAEKQNIALTAMDLGLILSSAGKYRQALSYYRQAMDIWGAAGNLAGQTNLQNNLGVLYHQMGDYDQAAAALEEALALARQNNNARMQAYITCSLGDLYADLAGLENALQAYQESQTIARQIDDHFLTLYTTLAQACLAMKSGQTAQASQQLEAAEAQIQRSDSTYEKGLWLGVCGQMKLVEKDLPAAAAFLRQAVECFEASGQTVEAARAHLHLAAALDKMEEPVQARAQLMLAFSRAEQLESAHSLVIAGLEEISFLEKAARKPELEASAGLLLRRARAFAGGIPILRRRLRSRASAVPFAPAKLTIQTLGRAQVLLNGKPVIVPEWQNQKRVRETFYCLLCHPDGLTRDALGLILWPDSSPAQLRLQFKNTMYRLRSALGQEAIQYDGERYWFNRQQDYEYDIEVFSQKLDQAKQASSTEEQIQALRAAMDAYRGEFLPEIDGTWAIPEREKLRQAFIDAAHSLARRYLETGKYRLVIEVCQRVLAEDECLEEAHRLAMRAYAALGDRVAVARQFNRCSKALEQEINTTPSSKTLSLYQELRQ